MRGQFTQIQRTCSMASEERESALREFLCGCGLSDDEENDNIILDLQPTMGGPRVRARAPTPNNGRNALSPRRTNSSRWSQPLTFPAAAKASPKQSPTYRKSILAMKRISALGNNSRSLSTDPANEAVSQNATLCEPKDIICMRGHAGRRPSSSVSSPPSRPASSASLTRVSSNVFLRRKVPGKRILPCASTQEQGILRHPLDAREGGVCRASLRRATRGRPQICEERGKFLKCDHAREGHHKNHSVHWVLSDEDRRRRQGGKCVGTVAGFLVCPTRGHEGR